MTMSLVVFFLAGFYVACSTHNEATSSSQAEAKYPKHWWKPVPKSELKSWEISPEAADKGEVILSKRNELGLLSNFAATPFVFRGKKYASLEGFWQAMKYPESKEDPRAQSRSANWPHSRSDVEKMTAFKAKKAGSAASKIMKSMKIDWVTFEGRKMLYRDPKKGPHYKLIYQATQEKLRQNPRVMEVLLATRGLNLKPDHHQKEDAPPAWRYYKILQEIRDKELATQ